MNINALIKIIKKDMSENQYQLIGKVFLETVIHSMRPPSEKFNEWKQAKSNPDFYIFTIYASEVCSEYDMNFITESEAIEKMKKIGAYHYGMPTEVEIRDFLNDYNYFEGVPI